MALTTKYSGKLTVLMYGAGAGTAPTVDLSGESRTTDVNQQGAEQDVSTRDDFLADATAYLANPPQRTIQHRGLDSYARNWHAVSVGAAGRVAVYPYGSSPTGYPYEIGNVVCTQANYSSPHDNAPSWDLQWRVNGTWTAGTT